MSYFNWPMVKSFAGVLVSPPVDPRRQLDRIDFMEENVFLPVKAFLIVSIFYVLYLSGAFVVDKDNVRPVGDLSLPTVRMVYWSYVFLSVVGSVFLLRMRHLSIVVVQWAVFSINLLDAAFIAACTVLTGAMKDIAYWIFLALIVRNAVSVPVPPLQIALNVLTIVSYVTAGIYDQALVAVGFERLDWIEFGKSAASMVNDVQYLEAMLIRVFLMLMLMACCYGVQVLFDRQRHSEEELEEYAVREEQLRTAGRLAAQIAHQIKNPLAIINNTVFSLNRSVGGQSGDVARQLQIIKEEVERSDRIITDLMNYAQLAEGRVESLDLLQEIDQALAQVFPPGAKYPVEIRRNYEADVPHLQMQRPHLRETLVNLIQNARDAMPRGGKLDVAVRTGDDYVVYVTISDTGPGIPADQLNRIFEAYYTTKEKGTGLGLAIVKQNMDIYGGNIRVESELGKGTRFSLQFRAKTMLRTH